MKLFDKTWKLAVSGAVIGLLVMLLAIYGNPANMAICVACFIRDTAGALKLHTAAPVQYFRPEVVGFVCGSFLLALLTREYKSTAGSSPMVRFILGAAMMIGALVFLGCPLRMVLRMAAGDLNAWVALIGFAGGVATGSFFLKKGFSLGRAYEAKPVGWCRCRADCPLDAASRGAWKLKFTRSIRRLSRTAGLRSSRARRLCSK